MARIRRRPVPIGARRRPTRAGHANFRRDSARSVEKTQTIVPVEDRKSLAHVGETDSATGARRAGEPHAVVGHAQHEVVVLHGCPDADRTGGAAPGKPVSDGVLHQRLQDESRNEAVHRRVPDVVLDREPVGESHALNVEIRLERDQLFAKRDLVGALREGGSKDGGQLLQHERSRRRRVVRELRHGAQRVEQEVRLELRLEIVQPRARERMLEPHRLALPVGERAADDERLDDGYDRGVAHEVEVRVRGDQAPHRIHSRRWIQDREQPACERGVDPGGGQQKRQMERDQRPQVRRQPPRAQVPGGDDRAEDCPEQRDARVDLDPTAPAEAVLRRESDTHRGLDLIEGEPGGEKEEGGAEAS